MFSMINIPTVLVLGAGASYPYGFPLGQELVDEALGNSSDLKPILDEIDEALANELDEFLSKLDDAHPNSIDAFLEAWHPKFAEVGKAVIAYHLMQKEDKTKLNDAPRDEDWYQHLLHTMLLTDGFDGLVFSNVSILTFNYDRSLECAIFKMLSGLGHSDNDCRKAMNTLYIRHLHGQIGHLPELDGRGRRYETTVDADSLQLAMDSIYIVHEPVENNPVFREAFIPLRQAKHVIFLGFGYLDRNVERLNLSENRLDKVTTYWGTGVGVTTAQTQRYARLFPGELPAGATKRITIDTEVKGVKEYMRKHEYLFMD